MAGFFLGVFTTLVVLALSILLFYWIKLKPVLKKVKNAMNELREPNLPLEKTDYKLQLKSLDGWKFDLVNSCKGKVVFLNFWATWCGPCQAEMPNIQNLYNHFKDNEDILILSVLRDKDPAKVREFLDKNNYSIPVYFVDGEIPEEFKVQAIPSTFVISRDGKILLRHLGAAKWDGFMFKDFLRSLVLPIGSTSFQAPL